MYCIVSVRTYKQPEPYSLYVGVVPEGKVIETLDSQNAHTDWIDQWGHAMSWP